MILSTHLFPAYTDISNTIGRVNMEEVAPDALFVNQLLLGPVAVTNPLLTNMFPNISGSVVGRPFSVECVTGRLFNGTIHTSDNTSTGFEVMHIDHADKPALLPADAVSGEGYGWAVTAPASPVYIGVGITAYPIYDDGHVPRVMHYVPSVDSSLSFPEYYNGYQFGWYSDAGGGPFGQRYPGLFISGYADLGYSTWGFRTAYNNGGTVYLPGFQVMPAHVTFGINLAWNLSEKIRATDFSVSVASSAVERAQELSSRHIIGLEWYGHGYWSGSGSDPYVVGLGRTIGNDFLTLSSSKVMPAVSALPLDYSKLFRLSNNHGTAVSSAKLGNLWSGDLSDTLMLKTSAFNLARGAYITYTEV